MAGDGGKWPGMAGNDRKRPGMAGNGRGWREMAGDPKSMQTFWLLTLIYSNRSDFNLYIVGISDFQSPN